MDDIIEESESTAEERPECAVSYRYKVYRRPDLNHPVILRVRDYEHEVLESKGRIAGSCKMLDWTDWEVMVSNLFEKKYAEMTRLAAAGELEGCISSYARELNDQKKGIIESVKAENLGKEMEDFRIRDWSNDAAMALETDYPDTDGEVYEDGLMPDLVRSCQCERLTDGDAEALCREKRYIVPLPGKIDWKFLRREAGGRCSGILQRMAARSRSLCQPISEGLSRFFCRRSIAGPCSLRLRMTGRSLSVSRTILPRRRR